MNTPRRAASNRTALVASLAIGVLSAALGVTVAAGAVVLAVARRVVVPTPRLADTRILDLNLRAQTITLARTPDTELPGRYGLFTTGTVPYLKLGSVLSSDGEKVTRKLLTHVDGEMRLARDATFSGWYFDEPEQLQLPWHPELIGTSLGPAPAWVFPGGDTWVVQIHGRGAQRAETLRAVPLFHQLGMSSILVSYRNDGEGPRSRSGAYGLGSTEWRDVDAAIGYAKRHGAKRILLMGWSMGGAIALQTAALSAYRGLIAGVILESPVVDWKTVLAFQAAANRIPKPVGDLAMTTLKNEWGARFAGGEAIPFDKLDMVANAGSITVPILILHSDDDGFVPADASHALAEARPDLVEMDTFTIARHTKLWNYDQARWEATIRTWLATAGFTADDEAPAGEAPAAE